MDGYCFRVSLQQAADLLADECPILAALGQRLPFEIAVGRNGRVWVNSAQPERTVLIVNAILASKSLNPGQVRLCMSIAKVKLLSSIRIF